jgi:hypothetical protein
MLKKSSRLNLILIVLFALFQCNTFAQSWTFIKEKDGVHIYSRKLAGKLFKSFKGVSDINAPAEKVYAILENVNNTDWWDKNVKNIKVLFYEKNKMSRYYMVYQLPWPFESRDLCAVVISIIDTETKTYKLTATPLLGVISEKPDLIRIKEYMQIWTVRSTGKNQSHIELESYVDPAGNVPDWLINSILTNMPIQLINGVKKKIINPL